MVKVGVLEEVEAAHFVRAVVRAVPRADAAVVDHVVQALGAVDGRPDRADQFARRVLAVHARHRLEVGSRGFRGRPRSSGRCEASASRGRASPAPCRRPGCCSPPGRRRRRRCSRCRRSGRSPCPSDGVVVLVRAGQGESVPCGARVGFAVLVGPARGRQKFVHLLTEIRSSVSANLRPGRGPSIEW